MKKELVHQSPSSKVFIKVFIFLFLIAKQSSKAQCVNIFPHVDDFETAATWAAYTAPTSSVAASSDWAWGTPNHTYVIHSAGSGSKCWSVGNLTGAFYNFNQQSYVQSPCYNFTNLQYPHVAFKLFYDSENIYDGGNLQSSIDGGLTWQDIGTTGEATDCNTAYWYNYASITYLNKPTGFVTSKHGWCGNVEAGGTGWDATHSTTSCVGGNGIGHWVTSEHCLTGLAGKPNVLLRFTFGAGYSCNDFDGLAFDSVAVSNGIINTTTITTTCGSGNTLNFNSGAKACPTNTWVWNFGDAGSGTSNTSTTQNPSHTFSGPGIYTVSVIASGGACNPPDTAIKIVRIMNASITSFSNVTCAAAGFADASVVGGTSPSYSWMPIGGNAAIATGLTAGNYTVSVTDPNACPTMTTITITQPVQPTVTATSSPAICLTPGSATATPTGGAAPYTYSWLPSGGTASIATGLVAGNYTVTITDINTCTATANVNISNTGGVTASVISTSITCNGGTNGSATVTPIGGNGPYTYTWSPSGGNSTVGSGLAFGDYTIAVSDAHSCTTTAIASISQPSIISLTSITTSITCNGGSNGTASVTATGGTSGYTYTWSQGGGNSSSASGLDAGNYTILVLDANLCAATTSVIIYQPSALVVNLTSTSATCGQANGTVDAIASGGAPGYTYTWSPAGGNSNSATGLATGNYTVTIKDTNNCISIAQTNVAQAPSLSLTVTGTAAKCGNANGTATAIASGGTGIITYTWSCGGNLATVTNLSGNNTYTISASDALGCSVSKSVTIGNYSTPVLGVVSNSITCNGSSTGSASVNINAGTGTAPYYYSWLPSGGTNPSATNLSVGNYTITVTDSSSCVATKTVFVNQPPALTITPTSTLATCGNANGMASCIASGGTPSYSYTWMPSGGNSSSANNLAGNIIYTVFVSDANNCIQTTSVLVNQTSAITLSVSATNSVTCFGASTGSSTVSTSGGTPSTYNYSWTPSGGISPIGSNLAAGLYTVSVQDNNLCSATTTLNIAQPPVITILVNNESICAGQTASLTAAISGGNGGASSYTWNPTNSNSQTITINPTVTNTYVVMAQNIGCPQTAQASGVVNVYPAVNISISTTDTICKGMQTTLSANATGGSGGTFTYSWGNGQNTPGITVNPSASTSYTVSAYDALCPAVTATTQVNIYVNPTLTIMSSPTSGCGFVCVSFTAGTTNVAGNNLIPPYNWNFGDGATASGHNVGHCYYKTGNYDITLTAITQNRCIDTLEKLNFIHVHQNPIADFSTSTFETDVDNGIVHFYNQSSTNVVSWNWNTDATSYIISNPSHTYLNDGVYPVTLVVTDSMGCKDTLVKDIIIKPEYTFYAPNGFTPNGDGINESFLPIGTGWDNNNYNLWIFDRWGNMIFHTSNPNQGWDGIRYNDVVQEDTYVWKVDLKDVFETQHEYHGQVSVVK